MTTLPTWALYAISFGTPTLTAAVTSFTIFFSRKGTREQRLAAVELELRSQREEEGRKDRASRQELMENVRWAALLAISDNQAEARLGFTHLEALDKSELADSELRFFIDASFAAVIRRATQLIDQAEGSVEVLELLGHHASVSDVDEETDLPSGGQAEGGG